MSVVVVCGVLLLFLLFGWVFCCTLFFSWLEFFFGWLVDFFLCVFVMFVWGFFW